MFVLRSVRWAFIPSDGPSRSIVSPLPHAAFENPKKPALNPTAKSLQRVRSPKLPPTHHPSPSIASAVSCPALQTATARRRQRPVFYDAAAPPLRPVSSPKLPPTQRPAVRRPPSASASAITIASAASSPTLQQVTARRRTMPPVLQ